MITKPLALVTGANRGIGLEVCRQLVGRGFTVLSASRQRASGEHPSEHLLYYPLHLTDRQSIDALREHLREQGKTLDVLVNNAGIALEGFNAEVAQKTLAVNFFGALQVTDALLPLLSPEGRIVMVSSGLGELSCLSSALQKRLDAPTLSREELVQLMSSFLRDVEAGVHEQRGWPSSAYSVSKVGLNALTRILDRELRAAGSGARVNAVCPGWVRTNMGGANAPRSVAEGADTIVWAATSAEAPSGCFLRDRKILPSW